MPILTTIFSLLLFSLAYSGHAFVISQYLGEKTYGLLTSSRQMNLFKEFSFPSLFPTKFQITIPNFSKAVMQKIIPYYADYAHLKLISPTIFESHRFNDRC